MANTADGALVEAARAGDQRAFGQLFDGWFDRVNDVSRRIVHDDGLAGEITQDTFLMAWTKLDTLQDVDAFGGWVLRIGRNTSLNRLARERRSVSMDDEAMTVALDANAPDHDPLADMDQAGRISLVWDAAAALGPRDQSVLDLHLRHGLSATELAGELGTTPNNAHQILFTLKKRLGNSVRALVLWRAGHPTCPDLRQGLSVAGLTSFGAPMVKAIDAHVDGCATCSEDRTERLNPAALFAAAPVIAAGTLVKAKAAAALTQAGVPMSGSASAAAAGSTGAAGGSAGSSGSALGTGAPDPSLAPGSSPSGGMGGAVGGGPGGPTALAAGAGAGAGAGGAGGATVENVVSFPPAPDGPEGRSRSLANRRVLAAALVLALVAIGLAVVLAGRSDSDDRVSTDVAAPPTTTGTSAKHSSTTDQPATSITTTTNIPDGTLRVIPRTTVPGSGDPGTTPPATAPPSTTPGTPTVPLTPGKPAPTTPPPTTTPGVDKPTILRFSVRSTPYACEEGYRWTLSWATLRADTVTVGWMQTPGQIGPADGKATICAPRDSAFFINADGPGGRASLTVQGEGPTPETTTTTVPPTTEAPVTKPTRPPGQTG